MRLKLVNLTKKFTTLRGAIIAVDNLSLAIQDNEFFVLLGPSGCGKTTLLNLIAGLEKPSDGEIWFDDMVVASPRKRIFATPKERNVAMVFQSYALYPHLNVFENIAFPLRIGRTKKDTIMGAVRKAASMLEISNLLKAKPSELSGGQRQRVAIARAIVRQPSIFLLDEPLSNLDAQLRSSTRSELSNLQRRLGITTIYVTHDQVEAMSLGDRIAILKDGRIQQIGSPEELYEKPINKFVATFIGSPPMNLLGISLIEEGGIFYIIVNGKKVKLPDEKKRDWEKLKSKSCVFGIRPEHICINRVKETKNFPAKITAIEPLGREMLYRVSLGKHELTLLTSDKGAKEGEMVEIEFDLKQAHIFANTNDR
jgi:multiple sugar transport system ATP-binding protein